MGLDTKYRPLKYNEVLGQESTIKILKQFVEKGDGFKQSYLFAGSHGCGKTTLGRILARALLCEFPISGEPCDACTSCTSILEGSSANFIEFDAATNSGKSEIKKITDELKFSTFSGKRRLYLMDESHRLSKDALDALLKPLEDDVDSTGEKRLICIFCTTEPEKMRSTVLSRCAPTFVIETLDPDKIASHLSIICDKEGIPYELEALKVISEMTECHVRDALKAVEGVSMLGDVHMDHVQSYLHLDLNATYLNILLRMVEKPEEALPLIDEISSKVSPTTAYEKLSDVCMLAYKMYVGVLKNPPSFWDKSKLKELGDLHGKDLARFALRLSDRPSRVTYSMLVCDIATINESLYIQETSVPHKKINSMNENKNTGTISTADGCYIDQRAIRNSSSGQTKVSKILTPAEFARRFELEMAKNDEELSGHTGRPDMGDPGTNKTGGDESRGGGACGYDP